MATKNTLAENQVRAFNKLIRISDYKLSLVADMIRGLPVAQAVDALKFSKKRIAAEVLKTLLSAVANAENNKKLSADSLFVKEIWTGKAITMKRYKAGARGQARPIVKPFSHLTIIVESGAPAPANVKKEPKKDSKAKITPSLREARRSAKSDGAVIS